MADNVIVTVINRIEKKQRIEWLEPNDFKKKEPYEPRPRDERKDIAFFGLNTQSGYGQCVIAEDKAHRGQERYFLITNHHLIPSPTEISKCKLIFEMKKDYDIVPRKQGVYFYSCCGPASVDTERPTHENKCCPRKEDWTVVILDEDFVHQKLKSANTKMRFPILHEIEVGNTKCVNGDIGCLERLMIREDRDAKGNIIIIATAVLHNIQAKFKNSVTKKVYEDVPPSSTSWITYPYLQSGDIGPGCSGGPILIFDDDSLLGIQSCYPESCSSNSFITAPSINLIIFSLYCGERYIVQYRHFRHCYLNRWA